MSLQGEEVTINTADVTEDELIDLLNKIKDATEDNVESWETLGGMLEAVRRHSYTLQNHIDARLDELEEEEEEEEEGE